ncbi:uncharacterized protein [Temnothorax nylanderi]|uniref:uncharacterized protein n=1 Tax=Temnothorax nylanderi TaxID=102681 RepID=UPI003A8590DC
MPRVRHTPPRKQVHTRSQGPLPPGKGELTADSRRTSRQQRDRERDIIDDRDDMASNTNNENNVNDVLLNVNVHDDAGNHHRILNLSQEREATNAAAAAETVRVVQQQNAELAMEIQRLADELQRVRAEQRNESRRFADNNWAGRERPVFEHDNAGQKNDSRVHDDERERRELGNFGAQAMAMMPFGARLPRGGYLIRLHST